MIAGSASTIPTNRNEPAGSLSLAAGNGQRIATCVEKRHLLESLIAVAPSMEIGIRHADELEIPFRRGLIDVHEALGIREGQRPQE